MLLAATWSASIITAGEATAAFTVSNYVQCMHRHTHKQCIKA
jgi:hypothetical protein